MTAYLSEATSASLLRPYRPCGSESDDIDVALDNVPGVEFAESVNAYLRQQGYETRDIGVIQVRCREG
jgi:hypothetical protein